MRQPDDISQAEQEHWEALAEAKGLLTRPLSHTAQVVLDALTAFLPGIRPAVPGCKRARLVATAIRALVEAKLPECDEPDWGACEHMRADIEIFSYQQRLRREFLGVADELEGK